MLEEIHIRGGKCFRLGRLSTFNVFTAYESIHYSKKKKDKIGACAIKLDMAKKYMTGLN